MPAHEKISRHKKLKGMPAKNVLNRIVHLGVDLFFK